MWFVDEENVQNGRKSRVICVSLFLPEMRWRGGGCVLFYITDGNVMCCDVCLIVLVVASVSEERRVKVQEIVLSLIPFHLNSLSHKFLKLSCSQTRASRGTMDGLSIPVIELLLLLSEPFRCSMFLLSSL